MPELIIFAGPNGAGKSTISKDYLESLSLKIESFDFDKEYYSLWEDFDFDPILSSNLQERTSEIFEIRKLNALNNYKDFSFETNFHTAGIIGVVKKFKDAGFTCTLTFILLSDEKKAIQRVKRRVKLGGHNVDEYTIRFRFNAGLKLLNNSFRYFDRLVLFHSKDYDNVLLANLNFKNEHFLIHKPIPKKILGSLNLLNDFIQENR